MLVETQAENAAFTGAARDWYWEVMCGRAIIARGLAATQAQARRDMDAVIFARAHPTPTEHISRSRLVNEGLGDGLASLRLSENLSERIDWR
jgi:hypothetical protein